MYRKSKGALPVVLCLLVLLGTRVYAGQRSLSSVNPDSLPAGLADRALLNQPALKQAVISAVNQRSGTNNLQPTAFTKDSIPFSKFGLNSMNTSAKAQFTQYLTSGNSAAGMTKMKTLFNSMKDSTKTSAYLDNKLRGFYALRNNQLTSGFSLPGMPENKLKGVSWTTAYMDTTSMMSGWWNEGVVQDAVTLGGIPVQINYSTLSGYNYAGPSLNDAHFVQFSFDRETYMSSINKQLNQNYDLKKYFLEDLDIKSSMKSYATSSLNSIDQQGIKNKISGDQLMYLDTAQLRRSVMGNSLPVSFSADSVKALAASKDSNDQALYKQYQQSEYFRQVLSLKSQMGDVKEMNQLLGSQKQVVGNIENWMNKGENTAAMGGKLLQLSALQKLMMNMQAMKVGSVGDSNGLFMSGAAGSFLKGNKAISLLAGNSSELGIQDGGMQSATGKSSYSMQGITLGKGTTSFTALNANSKAQTNNSFNTSSLSRNVFVGSVAEKVSLGELGTLDVTLSKSSSTYGTASDAAGVSKSAAGHLMDDLWATASVGLALNGGVKEWGLTHKVYINYSGLGYVNPGAPFGSRGTMQYGFLLKRSWLKNKAMVSVRTDFRDLATSALTSEKRKSITYAVDGRYRFTKEVTMGVNILQSSLREGSTTAYLNRKISFSSQVNGKINGKVFSNNSTIGIQQLNYLTVKTLFLNIGSSQTLMAGPGMIIASLNFSKDVNNAAVYNNLLNTEGGYQYNLFKKVSCGSSLIYMNSKDVVEQIGIRQQAATQLYKRWSVSLSADVRKNLFNSAANYYYGKFNTAMAVHYQIN
ncbi:hypothetical protein [Chitinophaga sancti]|uniref:Uncharacterized protein n=1 Tax=Chitinophaga sancti TaxID=1004 RepID=A0A1K1R4Q9_9BACT|nr:hypothetical protein [Chitinophaga sancti]WQD64278.1 hypothetical protein U0033_07715 [Chitinophaga sancti]WQG90098.1 hypothetical protein SR876_01205 [Chitinophaga sancti]SFW66835.1 hypothetical protein SAMN05661012_03365 [Chitinophaga sancti]